MSTATPTRPRRAGRAPVRWPGSDDVAALIGLICFVASMVLLGMIPRSDGPVQLAALGVLMVAGVILPLIHRLHVGGDVSFFLLVPTIMSALQNVYLLPAAHAIGKGELQVFIVANFVIAALSAVVLWMFRPYDERVTGERPGDVPVVRTTALLLVAVSGWGAVTVVLFHTGLTAASASYRNFVTPFLFLLLGLLASRTSAARTYAALLVRLGMVVVVFGFFERFTHFWLWVPLDTLWEKKNIPVDPATHLPPNFFSSEQLGGHQLRRMVSSFADPVNLGTFLFVVFVAAWFLHRRVAVVLAVIASILSISKGALLGLLMFAFFRTRYLQSSTAAFLSASAAGAMGLAFFVYTESHSTGSTAAHIHGLTMALAQLPTHPLGHGMGGTGVLAGLFSADTTTVSSESGLGVIIGQLGVIGVGIFVVFFVMLTRACLRLRDRREKVVAMSLLIGFALNAMFNEVALSPNSAAPYFVLLGLLVGAQTHAERREEREAELSRRAAAGRPSRPTPAPLARGSH